MTLVGVQIVFLSTLLEAMVCDLFNLGRMSRTHQSTGVAAVAAAAAAAVKMNNAT